MVVVLVLVVVAAVVAGCSGDGCGAVRLWLRQHSTIRCCNSTLAIVFLSVTRAIPTARAVNVTDCTGTLQVACPHCPLLS